MSRPRPLLYLLPPLVLSAWAFAPILANYFHGDDFQHLYMIADGRVPEFLVTPHGGHMLVARNALFVMSHALFGVDPRGYFWVALLTHLLNVGLLYAAIVAFTGRRGLACGAAALWGISRLNADALGWYSVYGQAALTTIMLAVLWRLGRAARDDRPLSRAAALGWYALVLVGTTCFGTGIGFALAAAPAVALCLPGSAHRFTRRLFASLLLVVPLLYVLVQGLFRAASGYAHDSVSSPMAALTAGLLVPIMAVHLVVFGLGQLLIGTWLPDVAYPGPTHVALAAGVGLMMLVALASGAPRDRRAILACLLLGVGAYGIIALGRGMLGGNQPWILASIATQIRYHYAPLVPLVVAGCVALHVLVPRLPARAGGVVLAVWLAALTAGLWHQPPVIDHYDDERRQVAMLHQVVAMRVAQSPASGPAYVPNRRMNPVNIFTPMEVFPGWAGLFIVYYPDDIVDGRTVRFIDPVPARVTAARARPGTRTAELLVTRAESGRLPPRQRPKHEAGPQSAPAAGPQ